MFAAGSAEPIREIASVAANPARAPEITYTAILILTTEIPIARADSGSPPTANTWVPNRVWNKTKWATTTITKATIIRYGIFALSPIARVASDSLIT